MEVCSGALVLAGLSGSCAKGIRPASDACLMDALMPGLVAALVLRRLSNASTAGVVDAFMPGLVAFLVLRGLRSVLAAGLSTTSAS